MFGHGIRHEAGFLIKKRSCCKPAERVFRLEFVTKTAFAIATEIVAKCFSKHRCISQTKSRDYFALSQIIIQQVLRMNFAQWQSR
jgi:hypothetical protein